MKNCHRKAFTLIELLLTVTILSVGIILILRSYLSLTNAMSLAGNKVEAIKYLDKQVDLLRLEGIEKDILQVPYEKQVTLNNKTFVITREIQPLYQQSEGEEEIELEAVKQVDFTINWTEGAKSREEKLISYVASHEEE
jgi:prepilin-type N-terminal cleavage/methylation domain-containing protein